VSAQETAYYLLGMPISRSSRAPVFIKTSPPDQRVRMVKSEEKLKELDPDSTDIMVAGLIEHYVNRPKQLDAVCLADIAANFNFRTSISQIRKERKPTLQGNDDVEEDVDEEPVHLTDNDLNEPRYYQLSDDQGYLIRMKISKIIRYSRMKVIFTGNN